MKKLSARAELALLKDYKKQLPTLLEYGLEIEDAVAIAWNSTLLAAVFGLDSGDEILERYSLDEIAELCELYNSGDEYGEVGGLEENGHEENSGSNPSQQAGK